MAATTPETKLPHMEFTDRMWKLPAIQSAWYYSTSTYNKIKDSNTNINWALNSVEQTVQKALEQVTPIAAPVLNSLEKPIGMADRTLCSGLTTIENHLPLVTEAPCKVLEDTKCKVHQAIEPTLQKINAAKDLSTQKAKDLRDFSWDKANEVLATQYGTLAVNGIDNSAVLAERLLDYYFPAPEGTQEEDDSPISPDEDKLLHTVQKVGRLSNKIARRVYNAVSTHIKNLKKEDVKEYVASLMAILQLTTTLKAINDKINAPSTTEAPKEETPKTK
ncbi:lipid storage droplets surface-binding protein 2 isoform X2 [Chrysoperla carnea]|uniref:lipid storage droplets surface-binding protein 2 isoform X2 n=1 Tax=Chrysoperla carnea TaxID=189513 RepID=UPI001D0945F2|nr:lipid storage droplets surface-binding protein 2 isoform X2 [Chrysoperla carnea]